MIALEPVPWRSLHGLRVSVADESEIWLHFRHALTERRQTVAFGYSLGFLPQFKKFPEIPQICETFQVMVCDGRGFLWLCRFCGIPVKTDITITDLMYGLLRIAHDHGYRVMLLGSDADSNRRATEFLRRSYPGAVILDGEHGYYSVDEERHVAERIAKRSPDILMIGMSSPRKELFVSRYREELEIPVWLPIGGNIDILSGRTKPIPALVKRSGLTWLYRIAQEPRRLLGKLGRNVADVGLRLLPRLLWERYVRKNSEFSIVEFYRCHTR